MNGRLSSNETYFICMGEHCPCKQEKTTNKSRKFCLETREIFCAAKRWKMESRGWLGDTIGDKNWFFREILSWTSTNNHILGRIIIDHIHLKKNKLYILHEKRGYYDIIYEQCQEIVKSVLLPMGRHRAVLCVLLSSHWSAEGLVSDWRAKSPAAHWLAVGRCASPAPSSPPSCLPAKQMYVH